MPGSMDGLKLAAVRSRWPPIKIIATSGHCGIREGDLPKGGGVPFKAVHLGQNCNYAPRTGSQRL
jgi:hypothetical protein